MSWRADYPNSIKAPKGAGQPILYLDFDGVLHHESVYWHPRRGPFLDTKLTGAGSRQSSFVLFQHAPLLAKIIEPYPDLKIVLSTSWVRTYSCSKVAKFLLPALRERVIGATFHSRMNEHEFLQAPRRMQVWGDVVRRKPRAWLALDDDYLHWPKWDLDNYVQTDVVHGISEPKVLAEIETKLAKMFSKESEPKDDNAA